MKKETYDHFPALCEAAGIPRPIPEYQFDSKRKWRVDFAFKNVGLAVEVEGGAFIRKVKCNNCKKFVGRRLASGRWCFVYEGGRHTSSGYLKDMEKYNALALKRWSLLRFTPQQMKSGKALKVLMDYFDV